MWFIQPTGLMLHQGCRRLERLALVNCPNIGRGSFEGHELPLETLRQLDVSSCRRMDDEALAAIVRIFPSLVCLAVNECSDISDAGLWSIPASSWATLKKLYVGGCYRLSDRGLSSVTGHRLQYEIEEEAEAEEEERIRYWNRYTTPTLHASSLEKLDISGCPWITDLTLDRLLLGCPRLSYLNVSNCSGLTRRGLGSLTEQSPAIHIVR